MTHLTEVAWGEPLQTLTHSAQGSEGGFCLESSSVVLTLAAESGRLWRAVVGQTHTEMLQGVSSAGGMKRGPIPL